MRTAIAALAAGGLVATAITLSAPSSSQPRPGNDRETLRPVSSFNNIGDSGARSVALFTEAGKVLTHARCVNCHPRGDRIVRPVSETRVDRALAAAQDDVRS